MGESKKSSSVSSFKNNVLNNECGNLDTNKPQLDESVRRDRTVALQPVDCVRGRLQILADVDLIHKLLLCQSKQNETKGLWRHRACTQSCEIRT
jgi:hypothetical protein